MELILQLLTLIGAMCMFLFGMTMMSEGLQKAAGDSLRSFLASMTSTRFKGIITGIVITALIQSSSGTTVMIVSMVNAGLLALGNAIGVIMGANIGTTITSWIISLFGFSYDIAAFAIPFIGVGFVLILFKATKTKNIGEFVIGFALLLIGLSTMKDSVPDLNKYPEALAFVKNLTNYGFFSVIIFTLVGALITVILQASSAAMALTMVFLANGWVNFDMAVAMVLGENIGTTITANIAAAVGNYSARRTALVHTMLNVIGVVIALIFFHPMLAAVGGMTSCMGLPNPAKIFAEVNASVEITPAVQNSMLYGICILHTIFNVGTTLILVWFIPQIELLVTKMIPTPKGEEEVFRLKYIQGGPLSTAELSLDEAKAEIKHFSEICYKDFGYVRQAILGQDAEAFSAIREKLVKYEGITDHVEYEIATYLGEVSKGEISETSARRIRGMYRIIGEMESLGDSGEAIGRMVQRRYDFGKKFDEEMLKRLSHLLDLVDAAYKAMIYNLKVQYTGLKDIQNAVQAEAHINGYRNVLREEHVVNIEKNPSYDYQTGIFYMDLVAELERMGDFLINISEAQLEENA